MGVVEVGIALAIGSAASSVYSYQQNKEGIEQQKKAAEAQSNIQQAANIRQARQVRREQRQKAAAIQQMAQNTGTASSSGQMGAVGSIASQAGSNIGWQGQQAAASRAITRFNQNAADAQGNALLGQTAGGIFKDFSGIAFGLA